MTGSKARSGPPSIQPLHAGLAWLCPGLGHWVRGERIRALRIFSGMTLLVLGGLLIGGVDVVDATQDRLWFIAQMGLGPIVMGIEVLNQSLAQADPTDLAWRSLGHVNSIGTLYIGLAGMLNVVVIMDAFYPRMHLRARRSEDAS